MRSRGLPFVALVSMLACTPTFACKTQITPGEVGKVIDSFQNRAESLTAVTAGSAPAASENAMWLSVVVRNGLIEQVGQLQILRMLLALRESVTGDDNKDRVSESIAALLRTVGSNAAALKGLTDAGRRNAADPAVRAELGRVGKDLGAGLKVIGQCRDEAVITIETDSAPP